MRLPVNNQWTQTNRSDVLGSLQGSFNLNLTENLGKIRLNRLITNTTATSGSATPMGFKLYKGGNGSVGIYTGIGNFVYVSLATLPSPSVAFTLDVQGSSPSILDSNYSDIEIFNNFVYVTEGNGASVDRLFKLNTTWSSVGTISVGVGQTHMMCVYGAKLYVSTGNTITSVTTADSITTSALTLASGESIKFIRASSNRIWIGVTNLNGGKGQIYEWDGSASQVTRSYRLQATGAMACVIHNDIPYVMDSEGRLLVFNSGTFTEIARLPFYRKLPLNNAVATNNAFIHPNGMTVHEGKINLLISNEIADSSSLGTIREFCPSGVWEFDENIGLYHKYSPSFMPRATTTVTDWGQNRITVAGALSEMKTTDATSSTSNGSLLAGVNMLNASATATSYILYNDSFETSSTAAQRAGYFVTSKIYSQNIRDTWQKVYIHHKKLLDSSDKIVAKYRTSDVEPAEYAITWVDTTHFTYTATSAETTANTPAYVIGDEVEITRGVGSGLCAHITDIHFSGSTTISVTIDETATGATTQTARARFQKWIKLLPVQTNQTEQFKELTVDAKSRWIQFKVFMIFKGIDEFDGMEIVNKVEKPVA